MERYDPCQYVEGSLGKCELKKKSLGKCELKKFLPLCKLLPENSTNHEDSRNSKEIQGVGSTLDFLEIS